MKFPPEDYLTATVTVTTAQTCSQCPPVLFWSLQPHYSSSHPLKNSTLTQEHAIMARQSWPLEGFFTAGSSWNIPGKDPWHPRCPLLSSLSRISPAVVGWSFLLCSSFTSVAPCLVGWIEEAVPVIRSRNEMLSVFEQTPNSSELLHTGCSDLGKSCWCAELFCNHALLFICSIQVREHYSDKLHFWASLHFKFIPKTHIEKAVWCFRTEIKPIYFYEGNVPG